MNDEELRDKMAKLEIKIQYAERELEIIAAANPERDAYIDFFAGLSGYHIKLTEDEVTFLIEIMLSRRGKTLRQMKLEFDTLMEEESGRPSKF